MASTKLATRYAKSILDLAIEREELESINEDMRMLDEVIRENRNLYLMLKSPIIKADKKKKIIYNVFSGRLEEMTMSFINIVISKKREGVLPEIVKAFITLYNQHKNITPVKVTTAVPLTEDVKEQILSIVRKKFKKDKIELHEEVDENIIGGFVLQFENKLYDASIAHQFEELRHEFRKNPYIKNI